MLTSDEKSAKSKTVRWYERALVYTGLTLFAVAIFIALVTIGSEPGVTLQQRLFQSVGLLLACALVATAYLSLFRAQSSSENQAPNHHVQAVIVFDAICFIVGGLVIVSFASAGDPKQWAATVIWALACLAIGAVAGFLFGIPRSRRDRPVSRTVINMAPNTSAANVESSMAAAAEASSSSDDDHDPSPIEQISDWLTKIIVGLGLANFKEIPGELNTWALFVGGSEQAKAFALGMILYFLILGFMACYILTQIFLGDLVNKNR